MSFWKFIHDILLPNHSVVNVCMFLFVISLCCVVGKNIFCRSLALNIFLIVYGIFFIVTLFVEYSYIHDSTPMNNQNVLSLYSIINFSVGAIFISGFLAFFLLITWFITSLVDDFSTKGVTSFFTCDLILIWGIFVFYNVNTIIEKNSFNIVIHNIETKGSFDYLNNVDFLEKNIKDQYNSFTAHDVENESNIEKPCVGQAYIVMNEDGSFEKLSCNPIRILGLKAKKVITKDGVTYILTDVYFLNQQNTSPLIKKTFIFTIDNFDAIFFQMKKEDVTQIGRSNVDKQINDKFQHIVAGEKK